METEELDSFIRVALQHFAKDIEIAFATTDQTMRCMVVLIGTDTNVMVRAKGADTEHMQIALMSALGRSFGGEVEIEVNHEAVH
jgi:phosphotransferase system HPr-like phosphotransfer protein